MLRRQQTDLSNLAKGSQVDFSVPYFDVFDPRFENFAVPVAVHGTLVYAVDDIARFNSINKTQNVNDGVFQQKLKGQVTKYVKGVVTNAPYENQIQVMQLERKILEISALVQNYVTPQIERIFGINVRSIDITSIMMDKDSRGYRELKAVTTDIEKETLQTRSSLNLDAMRRQQVEQIFANLVIHFAFAENTPALQPMEGHCFIFKENNRLVRVVRCVDFFPFSFPQNTNCHAFDPN